MKESTKKEKTKRIKFKKYYVFILLNIIFLVGCCIFYGSRLIYYYRLENPKIKENETLYNLVTLKKNIVSIGEGLYEKDKNYIYKGKDVNNYVKYSGRIWRIISVEDNNIKLITEETQTSLVWGIKTTYENSHAKSWLNNEENLIKTFYESLTNTDILVDTKTCIDTITEENITCSETIKEKVGLLSAYEYIEAGGQASYLNIGEYWWTSSIDSNNDAWYVYSKGSLNNTVSSGKTYYAYGIRPTITIKGDTRIISGDGTKENPYNLDIASNNILNNKYVGDYLNYSNYRWRIIETDEKFVKVVMDEVIKENDEDYLIAYGQSNYMDITKDVGYYLNNTFYNTLENKDYILSYDFNMGRYDKTYQYDFNKITEYKENMKVGLLQLGELFITDIDRYFLSSRTITSDKTIYQVLENGKIYAGSLKDEQRLRPAIYLKADLTISSGVGTKDDPYVIG